MTFLFKRHSGLLCVLCFTYVLIRKLEDADMLTTSEPYTCLISSQTKYSFRVYMTVNLLIIILDDNGGAADGIS